MDRIEVLISPPYEIMYMVFLLEGMAGLGIASLLTVALAEWGKFRMKAEKGFNWIALAGVWFLFAGTFTVATDIGPWFAGSFSTIGSIFEVIGWIFALIGTLFAAYEVLVEK